jgi:transcriptional regulator with XRE-family HTH domain
MTNLQLLRITKGMSQSELARKLGMRPCDLSKLENRWFAKISPRAFGNIKRLFGAEWTFETLMQDVAAPTPPALEEPPGDSEADELRKAS